MPGSLDWGDSAAADSLYGEVPEEAGLDAGSVFGTVTALRLIVEDLERLAGEADSAELREILLASSMGIRSQLEGLAAIPWSRLQCRRVNENKGRGQGGGSWPA